MSKCDSCTHKEVCKIKIPFQEFEKEKLTGKVIEPIPASYKEVDGTFVYCAAEEGKPITFTVEVKCSEYTKNEPNCGVDPFQRAREYFKQQQV